MSDFGDDDPCFIFSGICGLHVLNNSFEVGAKVANWKIVEFLRSLYNFLKAVPAIGVINRDYKL